MQKPYAILLAALMILSTAIVAGPTLFLGGIPTAHAGTLGTITASSNNINGTQIIQITVNDPDLTGGAANMPSITASKAIRTYNGTPAGLVAYQAVGGSWIAFVNVTYGNAAVQGAPPYAVAGQALGNFNASVRNAPPQDPTAPSGGFDNSISNGATNEPNLAASYTGDGATITARNLRTIINRLATTGAGDSFTITYNDSDPPQAVSVTISVGGRAGTISLDRASYPPGARVYISVADGDLNVDPTNTTRLRIDTANAATPSRNTYNASLTPSPPSLPTAASLAVNAATEGSLNETGSNTGVFENFVTINGGIARGSTVTVNYRDSASPAGIGTRTASAGITTVSGSIALDKTSYKISDTATITVTDPDRNLDSKAQDTIVGQGGSQVGALPNNAVYVRNGASRNFSVNMTETGANTGIYTGTFFFGAASAIGASPTINSTANNIITATYTDAANDAGAAAASTASALFATSTGTVALDRATYTSTTQIGTITVTDPDLNTAASTVQVIARDAALPLGAGQVGLNSTTANANAQSVRLTETGPNTGVFTGTFALTTVAAAQTAVFGADSPTLLVSGGATITAQYRDAADANGNANIDITKTASVNLATNTGSVTLNKAQYSPGMTTIIDVTDPDLNTNAGVAEVIAAANSRTTVLNALNNAAGAAVLAAGTAVGPMTETGPNTAVFRATNIVVPATTANGQVLTIRYADAADVSGNAANIDSSSTVSRNTGSVTLDKASYAMGGAVVVTVTDPDRNLNPLAGDAFGTAAAGLGAVGDGTVDLQTTTSGAGAATRFILAETGLDTGVFSASITLVAANAAAGSSILAARGDTITVTYHDAANSAAQNQDLQRTASVTATTGTIKLDKAQYTRNEVVSITVEDPDLNTDANAVEGIGAAARTVVFKSTTNVGGNGLALTETGANTGVFTGTVGLTSAAGLFNTVNAGDGIRVEYTDAANAAGQRNVVSAATATIVVVDGTVTFDKSSYALTDTATITLNDPDLNRNSAVAESYSAVTPAPGGALVVRSTSDAVGVVVATTESGVSTGVFRATITFTSGASTSSAIQAKDGDTITAVYRDWTPAGVAAGNLAADGAAAGTTKDISATATVGAPAPAIPATTSKTETLSAGGASKTSFTAGETLIASATVKNTAATSQKFLVAVQITAPDGTVFPTLFITVTLDGGKDFAFQPGFALPKDAQKGSWQFEVSVFDKFPAQGGKVKANPVTQTFTVA